LREKSPPGEAYAVTARLYAQLGLFERAQVLLKQYLQLHPDAVLEAFQLGMTHFDAGQTNEALDIWERILKQHPVHPPALFYKGMALAQQGKATEARQALEVLLKSAPADNLYFGRGKELLAGLDTGQLISPAAKAGVAGASKLAKDAYKTEH
jgi:tetratricopeptide (TPR) repeat protein